MTEEEKEKYEELKSLLYTGTISQYGKRKLIDIFDKQQKEIENLKEINKEHQKINGELREEIERQGNTREIEEKYIEENFISKDEIREKIKDLERKSFENEINYSEYYYKTEILKELLEEK